MPPADLPEFVKTDGEWDETLRRLYEHFEEIFKANPPRRIRNKVLVHSSKKSEGFEQAFWHIITKSEPSGERLFDPDRARRICWIKPLLDDDAPGASRWEYEDGKGNKQLYYWLEAKRYVLILVEKPHVVSLVTAFCTSQTWFEKDLRRKRAKGIAF